ncbi:phosphate/phosphite/phosphonate ABC transporter substrate-binding protein [Anaerovibrio slackiae]|uniref:substrate-binding domain-containing protein n=1 Tax=Anaerovibrio slackiae TaxID=2652309 RepID=UPI00386D25B2
MRILRQKSRQASCSALRTLLWAVLIFSLCLFCGGCEQRQGEIDFTSTKENSQGQEAGNGMEAGGLKGREAPLRIAFASVISPIETRKSYQKMVDYIAGELGRPAVLVQRKTYEELNMLLAGGEADIAFISTGAYTSYNGMIPLELLAMVQTDGTVFYKAYFIVNADSNITTFSQLRGRTFAFTDPLSYSGRLAVDYMLMEEYQATPEKFFQRCFYTYSHDRSLWAVENKLADGAGIDSQIYDYARKNDSRLEEKIRIIGVMKPTPTGPVVMRQDLPTETKQRLQEIFFHMDENPEMAEVMRQVIIDKFVSPQPEVYDELKRKYKQREKLPPA